MRIHHIGYLVRSLEKAKDKFLALGFIQTTEPCFDAARGIRICFMVNEGYCIELVEPQGTDSVVAGLFKRYRNTPYHLCYISTDFEGDISNLRKQGFMPLDAEAPAIALQNRHVIFLVHPDIGIIELVEG